MEEYNYQNLLQLTEEDKDKIAQKIIELLK